MGLSQDAAEILRTLNRECLGVRFGYLDAGRLAPELARLAAGLDSADCVGQLGPRRIRMASKCGFGYSWAVRS